MEVLKKKGFNHRFVDIVWRLTSNNYYSVLLNGPYMESFILQGELNRETLHLPLCLSYHLQYYLGLRILCLMILIMWDMVCLSEANLNHLAYADDTIIYASTHVDSLRKIMTVLQEYEKQSKPNGEQRKEFILFASECGSRYSFASWTMYRDE